MIISGEKAVTGFFVFIMEETPQTIWRVTSGLNDNDYTGLTYIVDTIGDFLVDPQGDNIIDTGVVMPIVPKSIWIENSGV